MHTLRVALLWATLGGCMATTSGAQQPARSPELERLGFYVGRWSEAGQMRDDPAKPFLPIAGGETCSWAAGGYAVLCEEKTTGQGGGWEGVYILSYDPTAQRYHVRGTEKAAADMHAVGHVEGDRWIWVTDPGPDGSRARYTFEPAGDGVRTMSVEAGDGQSWAPIVSVTYTLQR